jgi:uncharacterized protein
VTHPKYAAFTALDPFFEISQQGLRGLVDGDHYFGYHRRRCSVRVSIYFPRLAPNIEWSSGAHSALCRLRQQHRPASRGCARHPPEDPRVVIIEYDVHGKIVATGASYDNRFISVITIENRKIILWRDYMDSLAAWTALNSPSLATSERCMSVPFTDACLVSRRSALRY